MKVTLEGDKALVAALENMSGDMRKAMSDLVLDTAAGIEAGVKLRIQQGPKTGRLYKRGNTVHQASAPSEAPASDTGELIGSIYHERESELTAKAGSRLNKALWLEFGTTKMAPRTHWQPEREEAEAEFQDEALRILGVVLK